MAAPNRLAQESSPYLLQHAENPVDWHPWGQEAFALARDQDRPLFVSIGYSTCHWCHVMERECFMDLGTAQAMNAAFVCVKIDREERPDLDAVFMTAAQVQSGAGGWPLNLLLTPRGLPFFSATTMPRETGFGRLGLKDLCTRVTQAWTNNRSEIESGAAHLAARLATLDRGRAGTLPGLELVRSAYVELAARFDAEHGGFGTAPKFPSPHLLLFLLDYSERFAEPKARDMAVRTLKAIRRGGIFDQVGFGMHRYSTDRVWLTPHFEKMLYDQAMLAMAASRGFAATGDKDLAGMARDALTYVLRDMAEPGGGFATAEDADSENEEGRFYVFSQAEFENVVGQDQPGGVDLLARVLGVTVPGNFKDEATGQDTGMNILHLPLALDQAAEREGLPVAELITMLDKARAALLAARGARVRPLRDDKVLTDLNGLMIAALARCGRILKDEAYVVAAERAAWFATSVLTTPDGTLMHRSRLGQTGLDGLLDDHAFLAWGLMELALARPDQGWRKKALGLMEELRARFRHADGGFHLAPEHPSDGLPLIFRPHDITDGAIPSGNSVALHVLVSLGRTLDRDDLLSEARVLLSAFSGQIAQYPSAHAHALAGLMELLKPEG